MTSIPPVSPPAGVFRRLLVCFLGLSLTLASAWAQSGTGSLSGKITDAAKGAPLAGAQVSIEGTNFETSTDREGEFFFAGVPAGTQNVHVSYLGLDSKSFPATVVGGQRTELNAKLGDEVLRLDKISVQGQREGQARALNQQRSADNLKEIVTTDVIGRFPDQNASETLQRMSGVALERDQGDGRFVSIRGLYADLNSTQLNGVNIPSSENGTRRVNLDTIPTDLLESVELNKAITPDMDADAIGGAINLKTKNAFSQPGRIISASAEGVYNTYAEDLGHKYALTYGQRFGGDRWGFLFSISDQSVVHAALDSEMSTPWLLKSGVLVPNGNIDIREYDVLRERRGMSGSLDFHPTKDDSFFLRGTYNHFSDTEHRYRELFRNTAAATTVVDATHGTVAARPIQVDLKFRTEDNNFWNVSAGGEHHRDVLQVDYLVSIAKAELVDGHRFEPVFQSGNTSWSYDVSNPDVPVITGAFSAVPASNFTVNSIRLRHALQQDTEKTAAINVRRDMKWGDLSGFWKVGAKYRDREKTADTQDNRYNAAAAVNLGTFLRPSTFRQASSNPFYTLDAQGFLDYFEANTSAFTRNAITSAFGDFATDYVSDEDVTSGYAMASVTSGNLTTLAGVRVEQTDFQTAGWLIGAPNTAAQTFTATKFSRSYTNIMPGLHFRYKLGKQAQVRASFSQTLARPNFGDSSGSVVLDDAANTDTRGNPAIKPFRSDNFDLSVEYYPKSLGVMSLSLYAKNIKDFIFTQSLPGQGTGGRTLVQPLNGNTAKIVGLEATWQQQFTFLPSPFDGLGLYANATMNSSNTDYGAARPGENVAFSRQSKRIANLALSYEKYDFFLRVSLNYRSPFIEEAGFGADASTDLWVDDHTQIDVSANYKLTKNFTVYAEILNLTEEPYIMRWGNGAGGPSNLLRKSEFYKYTADFGVRFRY
jgi:TonB-dependent receptor